MLPYQTSVVDRLFDTNKHIELRRLSMMGARDVSSKALEGTFRVPRHPILFGKKYSMR